VFKVAAPPTEAFEDDEVFIAFLCSLTGRKHNHVIRTWILILNKKVHFVPPLIEFIEF